MSKNKNEFLQKLIETLKPWTGHFEYRDVNAAISQVQSNDKNVDKLINAVKSLPKSELGAATILDNTVKEIEKFFGTKDFQKQLDDASIPTKENVKDQVVEEMTEEVVKEEPVVEETTVEEMTEEVVKEEPAVEETENKTTSQKKTGKSKL